MPAAAPRRIALVVHPTREVDGALAAVDAWAADRGVDVVQLPVDGALHRTVAAPGSVEDGDLVVAVGGDGTVLASLRVAAAVEAPVLGVACGSLGALAAVGAGRIPEALARVWEGDWTPRSLPALSVAARDGAREWAANDFVVVRRGAGQVVAALSVDGELYARVAGDGLVVATALGSSAYSMAAGGPVLAADAPAFVCTPVAMHGGSAPPLVVAGTSTVTVDVTRGYAGYDIEIDGRDRPLPGDSFTLALHPGKLTLVAFTDAGRGLTGLRKRGLIADSPRVLARDARDGKPG